VIRDLAYHRGGKAILGMPKKPRAKKIAPKKAGRNARGQFVKKGR